MFETIIFDLDGTLFDNSEGIVASIKHALSAMGIPFPEDDALRRFIGPPLKMSFIHYCGMTDEESDLAVALYRERYERVGYLENKLYPGIRPLLAALKQKNATLAIATGKPYAITVRILEHFGILHYFSEIEGTSPSSTDYQKEHMIRRITGAYPGHAVMVGDTQDDIAAALQAGISGIRVLYGFGENSSLDNAAAVRTVDSPDDLSKLLLDELPAKRGLFIALEGLDGCGKTTAAASLEKALDHYGYPILRTREPGGCHISENIRTLLLSTENAEMTPTTEALLYAAARIQHVTDVILPAIDRGVAVISDRYIDSSLAYQGEGRRLGMDRIRSYNALAMEACMPDITVYLRLEASVSLARRRSATEPDRIESETIGFFDRVQQGFDTLSAAEPDRYMVIDASQPKEAVAGEIAEKLPLYLKRGGFWA